jgi:hypothetical protein
LAPFVANILSCQLYFIVKMYLFDEFKNVFRIVLVEYKLVYIKTVKKPQHLIIHSEIGPPVVRSPGKALRPTQSLLRPLFNK